MAEKVKKVAWASLGGDIIDIKTDKIKSKAAPIDNDWIKPYWLERDRILYKEGKSKNDILKRYGKA